MVMRVLGFFWLLLPCLCVPSLPWLYGVCSLAQSSNSLWPHGLYPTRLLCPWDFPSKNTRVGFHFILRGSSRRGWPSPVLAGGFFTFEPPGKLLLWFSSIQFSHSVMSNSLRPHESQHARPPCPSPTPEAYSNSCPLSRWCHPTTSSSVIPFSSCPQSLPASGSFPLSQLFTSGGQSIGVSASTSVLPMNTQDWSPSGWTGWIL